MQTHESFLLLLSSATFFLLHLIKYNKHHNRSKVSDHCNKTTQPQHQDSILIHFTRNCAIKSELLSHKMSKKMQQKEENYRQNPDDFGIYLSLGKWERMRNITFDASRSRMSAVNLRKKGSKIGKMKLKISAKRASRVDGAATLSSDSTKPAKPTTLLQKFSTQKFFYYIYGVCRKSNLSKQSLKKREKVFKQDWSVSPIFVVCWIKYFSLFLCFSLQQLKPANSYFSTLKLSKDVIYMNPC